MPKYRHPISAEVTEKSLGDYLALFDVSVRPAILMGLDRPDVSGAVCFEGIDMSMPNLGQRPSLIFGPGCTYKTAEEITAGHLGDVPSRFQYPTCIYIKENSNV
jgi:hypothetical protein